MKNLLRLMLGALFDYLSMLIAHGERRDLSCVLLGVGTLLLVLAGTEMIADEFNKK